MNPKQLAADAALEMIQNDMVVGLGTGSTAQLFIDALGAALRAGRLRGIRGVPTSRMSEQQARALGIPIVSLAQVGQIDIDVDGADEIDPQLNLIKGLGGALLREKIIAQNSRQMIVIADSSKRVKVLGTHASLSVEVVPFEHEIQQRFFASLSREAMLPMLRRQPDGTPYVTDNGNYIYDCRFQYIADPQSLEQTLRRRAGVVETGLFLAIATMALVADEKGVQRLTRA
jgi:ribose 5-phosphate isomerase A